MDTPPPLPAESRVQPTVFHRLANLSLCAMLAGFIISACFRALSSAMTLAPHYDRPITMMTGFLWVLGIVTGVVAFCGIFRHGAKGILMKSLFGAGVPLIFVGLAMPATLKAFRMAREGGSLDAQLKIIERESNKNAPLRIDELTMLDRLEAKPNGLLVYFYTVTPFDRSATTQEEFEQRMAPTLQEFYETSPKTEPFRKMKVSLEHRYHDSAGELIGAITVGPRDSDDVK